MRSPPDTSDVKSGQYFTFWGLTFSWQIFINGRGNPANKRAEETWSAVMPKGNLKEKCTIT